jgi:regulator of protease activity HflC (stomatin/prohibitin superfamily)
VRSKDGFNFPIDVRVSCAVTAQDAPFLVAMLGDPDKVMHDSQEDEELEILEAKIILPTVRAIFRNVAESMNALEFVNARSKVESVASESVRRELAKSRIILHEVFIGNIHMDATEQGRKLMETQTEKELASNQQILYAQQQAAETKRAELVKAQSEADRQKDLVQAQFEIQISESRAKAAVASAKGDAEASVARAEGDSKAQVLLGKGRAEAYKAMVESLGANQFTQLESIKAIAEGKIAPGVITPQILMTGGQSSLDALSATMLQNQSGKSKP